MNNSQGALYFDARIDMTQWRNNINEMRRDILGLNTQTQTQYPFVYKRRRGN